MIAFAIHMGFNFIDRYYVSQLGDIQLGALGMAFIVQSIIIAVGTGIGIGTGSLIARYIGAKKIEDANKASVHSVISVIAVSLFFLIIGLLFSRVFFRLLGTSDIMMPYILDYANLIISFSFLTFFSMVVNGMLRGEGNMVTPMVAMISGIITNFILDPVFIFGFGPVPALGIRGAAIATIIGRCVIAGVSFSVLLSKKNIIKPHIKDFKFNFDYIKGIFTVGGPTIISRLFHALGLSLIFILLKDYGDSAKAAYTIGFTFQQLAFLPIIGMNNSVITMTGQNFGAKNYRRIKKIIKNALVLSAGMVSIFSILFIIFSSSLVSIFVSNLDFSAMSLFDYISAFLRNTVTINMGKSLLVITSFGFPFLALLFMMISALQGMGMGTKALLINFCQIISFTLLAWILSIHIGINGIWSGIAAGYFISAVFSLFFVNRITEKLLKQDTV
jgi:putative MATE family efflux protein